MPIKNTFVETVSYSPIYTAPPLSTGVLPDPAQYAVRNDCSEVRVAVEIAVWVIYPLSPRWIPAGID
jgi:hypothetical protein